MSASVPPPPAANASARKRNIVLVGNCQVAALTRLYNRFVAGRTRDTLTHIVSYEELTTADLAAIEQADLIVQQRLDLPPKADIGGIAETVPRLLVPLVSANFIWPFAGPPHPNYAANRLLGIGPYGGEASDSYLNRLILAGKTSEVAVDDYILLDVAKRVNLDRIYELVMDRQRSRDEASGYRIANVVEQYFRTEPVFLSPHHPNVRVAVALAEQFFQLMGATREEIDRMKRSIHVTPFPKDELPIHPRVAEHFGLSYVPADRRYRFMNEGSFTFREYALRYIHNEWNEALEEGIILNHDRKIEDAQRRLVAGLSVSPASASGHAALSNVLTQQGRFDAALEEANKAVEIEPHVASYRAHRGDVLHRLGRMDDAETEFRAAINVDPAEPHYFVLLSQLLKRCGRLAESRDLIRSALDLDPYSAKLHEQLAALLELTGDLAGATVEQELAVDLAPENAIGHHQLSRLLGRLGRLSGALVAAEAAVELEPRNARFRISLSDVFLRDGKPLDALAQAFMATLVSEDAKSYIQLTHVLLSRGDKAAELAARRALQLDPSNAQASGQLSRVLYEDGRLDEAIVVARTASELDPGNPHRLAHLASLLARVNDVGVACLLQRRAVELLPDHAPFRLVLSNFLSRDGRQAEALAEARVAVSHQPDNARALEHLARMLEAVGDLEASEETLGRALELDPENRTLGRFLLHVRGRRAQMEKRQSVS